MSLMGSKWTLICSVPQTPTARRAAVVKRTSIWTGARLKRFPTKDITFLPVFVPVLHLGGIQSRCTRQGARPSRFSWILSSSSVIHATNQEDCSTKMAPMAIAHVVQKA